MSDDHSQTADQPTPMSRQDLEVRMIAKAWRDPDYEAKLLADPKAALQAELKTVDPSIELPEDMTVAVHPEDENTYHIVIPRNPAELGSGAVGEGDMEAVSPQTVAIVVVGVVTSGGPYPAAVVQAVVGNVVGVTTMGVANAVSWPGGVVTSGAIGTTVLDGPSPILGVAAATTII